MRTRIFTAGNRPPVPGYPIRSGGFTLLELVVVLVIMGIILGVTGPSFVGSLGGSELNRFTKVVASYLRNARELSVVRNVPVQVTIRESEDSIDCTRLPGGSTELASVQIPEMIEVTLEHDSGQLSEAILFYPLGNASGGRIVVESGDGERMTIRVDGITGDVSIE